MHPQLSVIIRTACSGPIPALDDETVRALVSIECPEELIALAERHRVLPWLAAALRGTRLADTAIGAEIVAAAARQSFQTLPLLHELSDILEQLNRWQVPVIVLKGAGLAQTLYPDRGLRPYSDIDILIPEGSLAAVRAYLVSRGYVEDLEVEETERLHECHGLFQRIFVHQEQGHVVEVHCDHLQLGLVPVHMDQIWERGTETRFGRGTARVLELHDLLVHLAVHLHRHGFNRLIWFKDLDLLIRTSNVDWQRVAERADEQGCRATVGETLQLLQSILGTPLPPDAEVVGGKISWMERKLMEFAWRPSDIVSLRPQRRWRLRRAVQFAPENGLVRGGLPSLLFLGRRRDKVRVLFSMMRNTNMYRIK